MAMNEWLTARLQDGACTVSMGGEKPYGTLGRTVVVTRQVPTDDPDVAIVAAALGRIADRLRADLEMDADIAAAEALAIARRLKEE